MPLSKSRWTGFGSEQPEFVARQTATSKSAPCKKRIKNTSWLKVLKDLRGLLLKKSPKQGLGQSPKVFPLPVRIAELNGAVEIAGENQL